jgi:hypothetical protein
MRGCGRAHCASASKVTARAQAYSANFRRGASSASVSDLRLYQKFIGLLFGVVCFAFGQGRAANGVVLQKQHTRSISV